MTSQTWIFPAKCRRRNESRMARLYWRRTEPGLESTTGVAFDRIILDFVLLNFRIVSLYPHKTMRFLTLFLLLVSLLKGASETALAQGLPGLPQASTDGAANLTWKATLMTGDDSIDAFDNARKTLKSEFLNMGVTPA